MTASCAALSGLAGGAAQCSPWVSIQPILALSNSAMNKATDKATRIVSVHHGGLVAIAAHEGPERAKQREDDEKAKRRQSVVWST